MQTKEHLIEQHIREFESRQRHIEEVFQREKQQAESESNLQDDLSTLQNKHDEVDEHPAKETGPIFHR